MTKRSLFGGALALLTLLVFAGCSNPSGSTEYVDRYIDSGFDYPSGTIFVDSLAELEGLLNGIEQPVGITHIAYRADTLVFTDQLIIPGGKTVYLEQIASDSYQLNQDIIVEPDAVLVLVKSTLATSDDTNPGKLLVKGRVDVYGGLTVTATTEDVADYYEDTLKAYRTVIKERVSVKAGGTLSLPAGDIRLAEDTSTRKLTPQEAWAAAGQGHLVISGVLAYPVTYMLPEQIQPSKTRTYEFETSGGDLPSVIPAGAYVTTSAAITDTPDHTLTVNGGLSAPNATFSAITQLVISGSDTDNVARSAVPAQYMEGYLEADKATLEKAETITIGDRGTFESESPVIEPPEGSKIYLGRNAVFNATNDKATSTFKNLISLFVGPGADVTIASKALTFAALRTLTVQDGARLDAGFDKVFSTTDANNPPDIIIGDCFFKLGLSPSAKINMGIKKNATLANGSILKVNGDSTLVVEKGATLAVETGAVVDFSGLTTPANTPPITIEGTIELKGEGLIKVPELPAENADILKYITVGDEGKIVLNYGTTFHFELTSDETQEDNEIDDFVAPATAGKRASYTWADDDDGAQIEINKAGITIRDTGKTAPAVLTVTKPNAGAVKGQTLTLEAGVSLVVKDKGVWFQLEDNENGPAKLKGPGKIVVQDTTGNTLATITGGSGWQVTGASIGIRGGTAATVVASAATAVFKALGSDAVIEVPAGKELSVGQNVTIALGGTTASAGGRIILKGHTGAGGKLSFVAAASKVTLGDGTGTQATNDPTDKTIKIGGVTVVNATFVASDFATVAASETAPKYLVLLGGTTPSGSIIATNNDGPIPSGGGTSAADVIIVSNAILTMTE
jgi:hypothetical protein